MGTDTKTNGGFFADLGDILRGAGDFVASIPETVERIGAEVETAVEEAAEMVGASLADFEQKVEDWLDGGSSPEGADHNGWNEVMLNKLAVGVWPDEATLPDDHIEILRDIISVMSEISPKRVAALRVYCRGGDQAVVGPVVKGVMRDMQLMLHGVMLRRSAPTEQSIVDDEVDPIVTAIAEDTPVRELEGMPSRTATFLEKSGVNTVGDLTSRTREQLIKDVDGIAEATCIKLDSVLEANGLSFKS